MGWFDNEDEREAKEEEQEQPEADGEFDVYVCHGDEPVKHHKVWVNYEGVLLGGVETGYTNEDGHVSFPIIPRWSITIRMEDYDGNDIEDGPYPCPDNGDGFTVDIAD